MADSLYPAERDHLLWLGAVVWLRPANAGAVMPSSEAMAVLTAALQDEAALPLSLFRDDLAGMCGQTVTKERRKCL